MKFWKYSKIVFFRSVGCSFELHQILKSTEKILRQPIVDKFKSKNTKEG